MKCLGPGSLAIQSLHGGTSTPIAYDRSQLLAAGYLFKLVPTPMPVVEHSEYIPQCGVASLTL